MKEYHDLPQAVAVVITSICNITKRSYRCRHYVIGYSVRALNICKKIIYAIFPRESSSS